MLTWWRLLQPFEKGVLLFLMCWFLAMVSWTGNAVLSDVAWLTSEIDRVNAENRKLRDMCVDRMLEDE